MRKKYLSALLFGALLFASAGTFTVHPTFRVIVVN